jgi:WD40 repeat protein
MRPVGLDAGAGLFLQREWSLPRRERRTEDLLVNGPLFELLDKCTVRLTVGEAQGTGFFVAPEQILTCAHVVESAASAPTSIKVHHGQVELTVKEVKLRNKPYPDLALLRIDLIKHPCVYLDARVQSSDGLLAHGRTREFPEGVSATLEYEGPAKRNDQQWFLRFKAGQIIPGYSGGPLLNLRTWGVCGVTKSTREADLDLGGHGIPTAVVLKEFPELVDLQAMFHGWDTGWIEARKEQVQLAAVNQPALPIRSIVVRSAQPTIATSVPEVEPAQLEPYTLRKDLYSPLSIAWYAEDRIALGSRDGLLRVTGFDGTTHKEIRTTAYPSYVAVHGERKLAALCYTKLCLIDLQTDEVKSVEIDPHASSYVVAWSPSGEYVAVGATNRLMVFTPDLTQVAEHAVGGKYGAVALVWGVEGTTLYAGLGNGELWRLTAPFQEHIQVTKDRSSLLALCSSGIDYRIACFWRDGRLEVRGNGEILASIVTKSSDVWAACGPKLVWLPGHQALVCTTGVSHELVFWQFDSGAAFSCRFARKILALDLSPTGDRLAIGVDEGRPQQDGQVIILSVPKALALLAEARIPGKKEAQSHLLTADWVSLLEWVEDKRKNVDPGYSLKLEIPSLEAYLADYEAKIRGADAEPDILRTLRRYAKDARQRAKDNVDDLLWMAEQMKEGGYYDSSISVACDRFVSFAVNQILGMLRVEGYPPIESLEKFVAFTLGYNPEDLLYLGFDARDGRGHVACVPFDFLEDLEELVSVGEALGRQHGMEKLREKVIAGCQLFHEFDFAFDYHNQMKLWACFVLPLAVIRYPREQVIIQPSEVEKYGLA